MNGKQPSAEQADKPIIEITDLRKVYRIGGEKVVALGSISLSIRRGEFCCLLGTSGSGKSTLLNMMAGLEKPTRGTVKIRGQVVSAMSEKRLARFRQDYLGFIFQSYNLLPALNALENVALPLTFKGVPRFAREKRARKLLAAVGLSSHEKHKPSQMSGGQQQRVGIARAFAAKPQIIFADEPTGNLDSKTTLEVMELMKTLARRNNQTIVMVTHDNELARHADRIIRIIDGSIQEIIVQNETFGG
ncbi:ABC transporter ATP-binding protein [Paenibacillus sp. NFR01]|uniref:ABC transporter ATP-binding protein n=1 Tax=Paenibacillus sp. NFR01 TaxID=1566279 RepID=UPI0008B72C0D|nr:ABC transporter ATP-binding protein [Paenibacillus sp. NFR01]SET98935.1 putative ABC transport system ATP-binding protein [Paenibacillus sp. NFR01]